MSVGRNPSDILARLLERLSPEDDRASDRRDVLRLALPAMGEQLLSMMVGLVDTFLVGHLGAAPLAAVGLANQWVFLVTSLFGSIAVGSTALIARFVGAREPEQANRVLRQSMLLGAAIGSVVMALGLTFARPAVQLLGAQPDYVQLATSYLVVVSGVFVLSALMFVGNASLRGAGDTRTPFYVMIVVNVLNILVAWTAINGPFGLPKLGVVGSALGAVVGRAVGGILVLAILLKGRAGLKLRLSRLRVDGELMMRILRVGVPSGIEQLFFRTGQMVFTRIIAGLGTFDYAASQVAISGWSLSFMPGFGFSIAATTLVGQALGAGEPDRAERLGYTSVRMGALLMGVAGVAFLLFPAQIVGIFTDDAQVIALGTLPLRLVGFVQPLMAANIIFAGGLRGAGDTRFPMLVTGASIWLFRLPLSVLLAMSLGWGLGGAWAAFALDISLRGVINFLRFRGGKWKGVAV